MKIKENQSENVTVNEKGQVLRPVFLRVNPETIDANLEIGGKPVKYITIGMTKYPCIVEMVTEEEYEKHMRYEQRVAKAEARERRCLLPDGKGGFIMCPESNRCRCCDKFSKAKFHSCRPVSLESLETVEDDYYCEPYPIEAREKNDASDLMAEELADMIEAELYKIKPKYALIFREMYNGNLKPIDIAANANLKVSTTYEDKEKVMKEAQKIFAILMK